MSKHKPIRVLIADDHELFLKGIHILIMLERDMELVGEAKDGIELISLAQQLKPDVIIVDIQMPFIDGIDATIKIKKLFPGIEVIGFSFFATIDIVNAMIKAGAKGYLEKTVDPIELISAIRAVHSKQNYFCKTTTALLAEEVSTPLS
jgi:DNA-binding NarL/FixJ family response regulator